MKQVLSRLVGRFADLSNSQPLLALFLGAALLCVFLTLTLRQRPRPAGTPPRSLLWTLYARAGVFLWACSVVVFVLAGLGALRTYLHHVVADFERSHGRITQANYNAVQTIWGAEQNQGELNPEIYWEEEVTQRFEPEDISKPAVLRKKTVRHDVTANPFISARHEVTLRQNARKKGSALYGGYETECRFSWQLRNPAQREVNAKLRFPLPAEGAVYDGLYATLNGRDVLPQMRLEDGALVLPQTLETNEMLDMQLGFKSRGMSYWYMQIKEAREIRDFTLTLTLPDLPKAKLNYPEGCMTPTEIKATTNGLGSVLTFRLDHAISSKGMGISLPSLPQPGETTNAVLSEIEPSWLLIVALLILSLTVASVRNAVPIAMLLCAGAALGYGLLGDFSDLLFGFWGTAALVLTPMFIALAWLLRRCVPGRAGLLLAVQFVAYGIVLPCVACLDNDRELLYLDLCALCFLAFIAWQFLELRKEDPAAGTAPAPA